MDHVQAPYYIEYRVNDVDDYSAEAAFGALVQSQRVHVRILRVVVRIGDYKQDSYFGQGVGETNILPLDNDAIALRHQIWLATDDAYKSAGQSFAEKQAAMKQFSADPSPIDDFAKVPVVIAVGPVATLQVDDKEWKKPLEVYGFVPAVSGQPAVAYATAVSGTGARLLQSKSSGAAGSWVSHDMPIAAGTQARILAIDPATPTSSTCGC